MWFNDAVDDGGNVRVDFVYGNVPPQPEDTRNFSFHLGDGEGEFYLDGHATAEEFDWLEVFPNDYLKPSLLLGAGDSHKMQLSSWNGFPASNPNTGSNYTSTNYAWITDDVARPAAVFPWCVGLTADQAQRDLRSLGIAEDVTREFLSTNENPYDLTGTNTSTGENILQFGNIIYMYLDPETPITFGGASGTHWDGSPWLAKEAEGLVISSWANPGTDLVPIDAEFPEGYLGGKWLAWTLMVVTNDPTKDQYEWWLA
ncbi:hypothetical protein UFOVP964_143 [uncultured Caudovirales phage]|uniref:Uncharacterized protein n=1 Tax=uncultured Caudovirales phage TaxID=2100421 RepID=A0A6J7XL09_9CAUD|nr:hypothetical protein UFOVP854_143 [uncultured Caudovirales phage]CAB4175274.1 hypothetical protein UFOVP964_143 [uncultured Caudovirales phage]CAB4178916.1 hypothetical protein UFOVP1034_15 [uncultured Caudovirales phage]CAB4189059.1 hypothetical protein UFOVP1177_15 [uncultured Caudovirales phage]CAB4192984.1 hypothetical protein UFOVP1243_2 [uncultured Caudovirales phage]